MTEEQIKSLNLLQRMAAITAELQTVEKDLTIGYGNQKYSAVSVFNVLKAVKPLEAKYRVYSRPVSHEILESDTLEKVKRDGEKSTQFYIRIKTIYRFSSIDDPDPNNCIEIISFGDGIDSGDKAPGKAMTYAIKYALIEAYKISTGDDPDQEASPEEGYQRSGGGYQRHGGGNAAPPKCADCGAEIRDTKMSDGGTWRQPDIIAFSTQNFGRCLCVSCIDKRHAASAQNTGGR